MLLEQDCGDGTHAALAVRIVQRRVPNLDVVVGLIQLGPRCVAIKASEATAEIRLTALVSTSSRHQQLKQV